MRRLLVIPTAMIIATLTLAGCTPANQAVDSGVMTDQSAPQPMNPGTEFSDATVDGASGSAAVDRAVITTGYVTITVDEPVDAAAEATRITEQAGGRVDGRSEYAPVGDTDKGSATLTLRIPSADLDATLDKLRELGDVQEVSLNSSDVTMETQDLDARITALSASVDRLLVLLEGATDTDTLIALETAISDRQAELESLESQQRYLNDQVDMSTVTLNLLSTYAAPVVPPDTFLTGLEAGWNALVAFFAGVIVAAGVLLPWIILLGLIALVIIAIVRRKRRTVTTPADPSPSE